MHNPSYFGGNIDHRSDKIFPWDIEAKEIMRLYTPKCIVLDLDFTLWPTFFASNTHPPYVPIVDMMLQNNNPDNSCSSSYQSEGKPSQILCLDRKTFKPRMLKLYPEVQRTIRFCLDNQILISIASKNSNHDDAKAILRSLELWNLLYYPQIFYSRKTFHFRNLKSATKLEYHDFMFFDDDNKNISICKNIGVNCFRVDRATGFNGNILLKALKECVRKYYIQSINVPVRSTCYTPSSESLSSSSCSDKDFDVEVENNDFLIVDEFIIDGESLL